jgi:hypothetical protein
MTRANLGDLGADGRMILLSKIGKKDSAHIPPYMSDKPEPLANVQLFSSMHRLLSP